MASNRTHHMRPTLAWMLAILLVAMPLFMCMAGASSHRAYAEDIDTDPTPDELQLEIERTAVQLEEARAQVAATEESIQENSERIAELEALLPAQQARSDAAVRELYKSQQQTYSLVEILLSSESMADFLSNLEYINQVTRANMAEIERTRAMQAELEGAQAELESTLQQAQADEAQAEQALAAAQEARAEAQRRAEEAARQRAEQEAAAAAAAAAAQQAAEQTQAEAASREQAQDDDQEQGDESQSATTDEGAAAAQAEASAEVAELVSDGADWSADQEAFVAEWSARIDAYLAGSPMAGQGRTFAVAAWNYGVDPRWSPAIAYTESSLGAACFLPYNAWGWGSESWGSWEEAIDAHVRGLARGYGYTISLDAAKKYCPPNYQAWYERTLGQMNLI